MKTKVLVTGANGQLGRCIKKLYLEKSNNLELVFVSKEELDITNSNGINYFFEKHKFNFCINCAAYTAVDAAEDNKDLAYNINVLGAKNLAQSCKTNATVLIHISTDFVFEGNSKNPYNETDQTNPLGIYGLTKLQGEQEISAVLEKYYIIRTSWLYSEYKTNFVKTMLRLASEREELSVVNDQKGSPTNANDLALVIINIIEVKKALMAYTIIAILGETTWFGFAKAIFEIIKSPIKITPITSQQFITKAKRPSYSVLDKTKIISVFDLNILDWKMSLEKMISVKHSK